MRGRFLSDQTDPVDLVPFGTLDLLYNGIHPPLIESSFLGLQSQGCLFSTLMSFGRRMNGVWVRRLVTPV